jgi:hypothetical protein
MREIVRGRRDGARMLFALFALSMLFAHDARAQSGRAFTQDAASAPAQCGDGQLSLGEWWVFVDMGSMRYMEVIFTNASASPCTLNGHPPADVDDEHAGLRRGRADCGGVDRDLGSPRHR